MTLAVYLGVLVLGAFIACQLFNDTQVLNVQLPDELPRFALYVVFKVGFCLSLGSLIVIFGCATRDALANRIEIHPACLMMPASIHSTAAPAHRIGGLFRPPRSIY